MENGWDNTKRAKRLIFIVVPQLRIADGYAFHYGYWYNLINTDTLVILLFLECVLLFV